MLPTIFPQVQSYLLPVAVLQNSAPTACSHCRFINPNHHHFCTNCGYPVFPNQYQLALYNVRLNYRKAQLKRCREKVSNARNVLYIAAALCMLGVTYLFEGSRAATMRGLVYVVISLLLTSLGRWSISRPFTSMLISFLVLITLVALNTWVEFALMFTSVSGVYVLVAQLVLLYFLTQGVKAAYQADILEEEMMM